MSDKAGSEINSTIVTRCPTCETAFRVTPEQLEAANGMVRCGNCIGVFNAPEHQVLSTIEPPTETKNPEPSLLDKHQQIGEELPRLTALIHNEFDEQQPAANASNSLKRFLGRLAVIALGALALGGQTAYFLSGELSRNENYRQVLIDSCFYLGCKIDPYSDVDKLTVNTAIIQSHPTQPGAVIIDMLIENQAQFRQPYPKIKVRFDDLHGQLIAQRIFSPQEYISGQNPRRSPAPKNIASGRQAHISFSLVDPGLSAVNYLVELSN
ncbi:MAG: zinc-ribbon and DUF3426 domain-containing protein [Porticoccaceae bacterium]